MFCYGFMLLTFLAAKKNKLVNSFLVVLVGQIFWTGGSVLVPCFFAWDFVVAICLLSFY